MQKNRNSISTNMRLNGTTWKLGFFFSFFLIFISNSLFAFSGKISIEEDIDSSNISKQQTPTVIHVTEGTTVYGLDLISKSPEISSSSDFKRRKKHVAHKTKVIALTKKNVQIESKSKKPETKALASNPSNNSFNVSKHSTSVGTITVNNTLKSIADHTFLDFKIPPLSFCNNSLFKYSIPLIKEVTDRYSFTRPPPFA